MNLPRTRLEALAPPLAGLLLAVPVLVAFYPPMTDLGLHEGAIGIWRHLGDPAMVPPGLYQLNLGEPNQLFYLLGWALSYATSTRWAVKLVVIATVFAIPVCAARFARHVGGSPLAALLVAPLALGWLFSWGLIANLVGLAALLAVLPFLDTYAERPDPRTAVGALAAVPLLYLAHEAMMFVYGGAAILLALVYPWSRRATPLRLLPAAAVAGVHEVYYHRVQQFVSPTVRKMPILWHPLKHKLTLIPYLVLPATDPLVLYAMFALVVLTIGMFLWLKQGERRSTAAGPGKASPASRVERLRSGAQTYRWATFALACIGLYLAFPLTIVGSTLVYQRFFPPAYAVAVLIAAPRALSTTRARVARIAVLTLPVATLLIAWPAFVDSNRQYEIVERLLPSIEKGSAVVLVDLGPGDPSRTFSIDPAAGRVLATRGGRLAYSFTDSPISPVLVARRFQWNESLLRLGFDTWSLRPAHDLHMFSYVLLRTTDPRLGAMALAALRGEADYVAESGDWVLLKSRLTVISPTSSEPPMPSPPPETLRERINGMVAVIRGDAVPMIPMPRMPPPSPANGF